MSATSSEATCQRIRLRNGRSLSYATYGDPHGKPVLLAHRTAGSRLERHPDDAIARSLGARLIVPDRPGYGLSTFQRGRTLLEWPEDVVALADALGIERFALLGLGGGGPHALACACRIGQRLTRVALVGSPAPYDIRGVFEGMPPPGQQAIAMIRHTPLLLLAQIRGVSVGVPPLPDRPAGSGGPYASGLVERALGSLAAADRVLLAQQEVRAMLRASAREAHRRGGWGHAWEDKLLTHPWGLALGTIATEVHVWQPGHDYLVPPAMGRYLAAAIPTSQLTVLAEAGTLLFLDRWAEILVALVA